MFRFRTGLLAAALASAIAVPAAAAPILGGPGGLSNPTSVVTFDELGNLQGVAITNQFAAFGVTFSPYFDWDNATQGQAGSTGFSGGDLSSVNGGGPGGSVTMTFTVLQAGAAFAAVDQGGSYRIESFLGAGLVESFVIAIPTNPGVGFIGFENSLFDSIRITALSNTQIAIDNLQMQAVPEPGTLLLLGSGLATLAARRRRRA